MSDRASKLTKGLQDILNAAIHREVLAERLRCFKIAKAYAEENMAMGGDATLLDPIFSGQDITPENIARNEDTRFKICGHSSAAHAAQNIADMIMKPS